MRMISLPFTEENHFWDFASMIHWFFLLKNRDLGFNWHSTFS
jgi:hypothetical protein